MRLLVFQQPQLAHGCPHSDARLQLSCCFVVLQVLPFGPQDNHDMKRDVGMYSHHTPLCSLSPLFRAKAALEAQGPSGAYLVEVLFDAFSLQSQTTDLSNHGAKSLQHEDSFTSFDLQTCRHLTAAPCLRTGVTLLLLVPSAGSHRALEILELELRRINTGDHLPRRQESFQNIVFVVNHLLQFRCFRTVSQHCFAELIATCLGRKPLVRGTHPLLILH